MPVIRAGEENALLERRLGQRRNNLKRPPRLERYGEIVVGQVAADLLPVITKVARTKHELISRVERVRVVSGGEQWQLQAASKRRPGTILRLGIHRLASV